jgi:hypothetical protein
MTEIAGLIRQQGSPRDSVVLVDSTNSDPLGMMWALGPGQDVLQTGDAGARNSLARALADPRVRTFWFLRNTHDVSPAQLDAQFEAQLRPGMTVTAREYGPFSRLETALMRRLGMADPPRYFHELLEFRR